MYDLFSFAVGTKHVDDFMLVELGHQVTCRTAVLTRIELTGFLCEYLTNGSGESQTGVGVNVDFANSRLGSLAELFLRNTYSALLAALRSCSSGIPTASGSLPPYLLIISTYSCGTLDEP